MKKGTIYLIAIVMFFSCNRKDHNKEIDSLINKKIEQVFEENRQGLWNSLEEKFFNKIFELGYFKKINDTINAIHLLNNDIQSAGFREDFFLDTNINENNRLISNLKVLEFKKNDECANIFLYDLCGPIVNEYESKNAIILDSLNYIKYLTLYNPDSVGKSFDMTISNFEKNNLLEQLWKNPGTRKIIILIYFNRMISDL